MKKSLLLAVSITTMCVGASAFADDTTAPFPINPETLPQRDSSVAQEKAIPPEQWDKMTPEQRRGDQYKPHVVQQRLSISQQRDLARKRVAAEAKLSPAEQKKQADARRAAIHKNSPPLTPAQKVQIQKRLKDTHNGATPGGLSIGNAAPEPLPPIDTGAPKQ